MLSRVKTWYSNLGLQTKFFSILLLSLLLVFSATFLTSRMPYGAYNRQLYERSVQVLTLFAQEVQSELDNVAEMSFYIIGDNVLQSSLTAMRKARYGSEQWIKTRRELNDRMDSFSMLSPNILSIRLWALDGTVLTRSLRGVPVPLSMSSVLEDVARVARGREVWVPDPDGEGTLILVRDVREIDNLTLNSIGLLTMRVDLARMVSRRSAALQAMELPLATAIYADGIRLYASDAQLAALQMDADGFAIHDVDGTAMFCVRHTTPGTNWTYITAVPYESVMRSIGGASRVALLLALAVLVLALVTSALLIASILRHFKALLAKYDAFAQDTLQPPGADDPYRLRKDEIGSLHRHFDKMAADYARMIQEIYVKQQLLLEAQVRQLRAQIQPHFLYNTLESIYCLAESGGDPRIATMTHSLGKMLRATLSDKRDIITIAEDMRIARDYLDIQLIRYGDKLQAAFEVDAAYHNIRIPAMTVQPLVENAIRHAVEQTLESCQVRIFCREAGGFVELVVADNGPGMDEDTLEKLDRGELQAEGLGIGLRNIHRRLRLAFSDACGLRITREADWTSVIVRIPKEEEVPDETAAG